MRTMMSSVAVVMLVSCGSDTQRELESSSGTPGADGSEGTVSGSTDDGAGPKLDLGPDDSDDESPSDTEACAAQTAEAQTETLPVDIIVVVDTSPTMAPASDQVEANIQQNFASILAASGLDYRFVLLAAYGGNEEICIGPPLGGPQCDPLPATPAETAVFHHYDHGIGSSVFFADILSTYGQPDPHGLAPDGWSQWLRPEAVKVFVGITDSTAPEQADAQAGDAFDTALLDLGPEQFGTAEERRYVFHTINGVAQKANPTDPWLPDEALVESTCEGYDGPVGTGLSMQRVSQLSGGLRFPLCQFDQFDVVFGVIAEGVTATTPISCRFPIPEAPAGETIDPDTIEVDYAPGGAEPVRTFHQVTGLDACEPDAFYVENAEVVLCPSSCAEVQADLAARLDVRYGCDVGFEG